MPKGVLWRNGDAIVECFGGSPTASTLDGVRRRGRRRRCKALLAPPFMHGAGHWVEPSASGSAAARCSSRRTPSASTRPTSGRSSSARRIDFLLIVGDAFARPLLDELDAQAVRPVQPHRAALRRGAAVGEPQAGAPRPPPDGDDRRRPRVVGGRRSAVARVDRHAARRRARSRRARQPRARRPTSTRELTPGDDELGWLAKSGRLALGYLGDADKTARTYPRGRRRPLRRCPATAPARAPTASIELHGRDSVTINSGGEKIFAEEVEAAVKAHPAVYDCVVAGRPSERWGNEVVAVVRPPRRRRRHDGRRCSTSAGRHIARYKLPKAIVFVDEIVRSPAGKADYRWARQVAAEPL